MNGTTTGSALLLALLAGCGNEAAPPAPEMAAVIVTGTSVTVRTTAPLSTTDTKPGDTFVASLEEPLRKDGHVWAPKGSIVEGRIVAADPGSRPRIAVQLSALRVAARSLPISTNTIEREAKVSNAGAVAGDAVIAGESVLIFELKAPLAIP